MFSAERPQVIVHQAALADVRASVVDPAGYAITNIVGTLNLLEAARTVGTRAQIPLCIDRRRGLRRSGRAARHGAVSGGAARPVRREQAGVRVLHRHLPSQLWSGLLPAALCQRLRAAAGSGGRGGGRRHLHGQDAARPARGDQRRRQAGARFCLRWRCGARKSGGAGRVAAASTTSAQVCPPTSTRSSGNWQRRRATPTPRRMARRSSARCARLTSM